MEMPTLHGVPGGRSASIVSLTQHRAERERQARARLGGRIVGMVLLWTSGIHVGIVAAGPDLYRHFADTTFVPGLRQAWTQVVMADPVTCGLLLALAEATLGGLLLVGGRWARAGWIGVIAFQVLLMLFGFGFWMWSLPALTVLVPLAWRDWPALGRGAPGRAQHPGPHPGPRPGPQSGRPSGPDEAERQRQLQRSWAQHPANGGLVPQRPRPVPPPGAGARPHGRSRARSPFSRKNSGLSLVAPSRDNRS
jgi:hypothetical protein